MANIQKFEKIFFDDYPYCYVYEYSIHDDIQHWLEGNEIDYKFFFDGDDPWGFCDTFDTVNFKMEEDVLAFVIKFS